VSIPKCFPGGRKIPEKLRKKLLKELGAIKRGKGRR